MTKPEAWLQVTTTPKLELDRAEQRLTEYNKKNRDRSEEPTGDIKLVRLAGLYHCGFVKKYCWLICVREKYYSG